MTRRCLLSKLEVLLRDHFVTSGHPSGRVPKGFGVDMCVGLPKASKIQRGRESLMDLPQFHS